MMILKNSTLARTFSQQTIDQENQKQIISDKVFKAVTKDCGKWPIHRYISEMYL